MSNYTPGNWRRSTVHPVGFPNHCHILSELGTKNEHGISEIQTIAVLPRRFGDHGVREANANLLAASKDMYEALKKLSDVVCELVPQDTTGFLLNAINEADNAIAKAEGRNIERGS